MKQYKELLKAVKEKGTYKKPAREGMPRTLSLFGYQFRHDLSEGFPLLTTKKLSFKNIVVELLWFLKGDTNIKYLIDNGCNIWNEDAYNYYVKKARQSHTLMPFEEFVDRIKKGGAYVENQLPYSDGDYILGDCGEQYGALWRRWKTGQFNKDGEAIVIDQLQELIRGLKHSPTSRRHIITAWNPATLNDMALNACHALVQFNCRPTTYADVGQKFKDKGYTEEKWKKDVEDGISQKYYLDCQMYQRSADLFLGVPYNIASYALLTHILCKICNMVPGDFIHTFGDVHIYENHMEQVEEQLSREERELPQLIINEEFSQFWGSETTDIGKLFQEMKPSYFSVTNYNPHPAIKGELSTGLKK